MLKLYHAPMSRSSRLVWLNEELGAPCEIVYVDIPRRDGTGAPDPRNPHHDRKVPALDHDGVIVTESIAVAQYLADLFPEAGLAPRIGDPRRGPYLSWLAYYVGVMEPLFHFGLLGVADSPVVRGSYRGRAEVDRRVLSTLENSPFLVGDGFTAADIIVASIGQWMREWLPEGPVVDDYLARCAARPAFAAAVAKDSPPA